MDRRSFLCGLAGAVHVAASPGFAWAAVRRIGFVFGLSRKELVDAGRYDAFMLGMKDMGYVEGRDYVIDFRFAEGRFEQLPAIMSDLVRSNVDLIVSTGTQPSLAAKEVTRTIPVVITAEADPVRNGFAASLARPGGNMTGFSTGVGDLVQKHPELLKALVPRARRIAVLRNASNPGHAVMAATAQSAAQSIGLQTFDVMVDPAVGVDPAFAQLRREKVDGLIVLIDQWFIGRARAIADSAARLRLPAIYAQQEFAEVGGLVFYGQDQRENYRRVAIFIDKIFKGAHPGDLPFEQPTKLTLILNRKAAKVTGVIFPKDMLLRADRVIE